MQNKTQQDIIEFEIESILDDIRELYNASGKRTSSEFEEGLEVTYGVNKATIEGYTYLAGRKKGKMPPVKAIEEWIKKKGIRPIEQNMKINSLAWAIAKSIAKKGTDEARHLKVYEKVITPERINNIIEKVSQFNVNLFINEITASLTVLQKNV